MEEILQKLEILKNQMKDDAAKSDSKFDTKDNNGSEKLSGIAFDNVVKKDTLKGCTFAKDK